MDFEPAKKARVLGLLPFFIKKDVFFLPYALCSLPLAPLLPRHEQVGQEHGDGRDIGDHHEGDKHRNIERNTTF